VDRWWFPARFHADGVAYAVDLQFAGAQSPGSQIREQSWRVRFRGKERYRGMRGFDLAPADERRHAVELTVRGRAGAMGLLAPPGGFATLTINGAEAGTFFWSEENSGAMLARLGYPKGEILTPNRGAAAIPTQLAGTTGALAGLARYRPVIDPDRGRSIAEEKLARLVALLRNAGDADFAREVPVLLDVEKFLRWNALVWVFGSPDSDGFPELSWFFDPVTGLLEPIVHGFAQPSTALTAGAFGASDAARLTDRLLRRPAQRTRRNEILWESVGRHGNEVVAATDAELGSVLTQLAKSLGSLARLGELRDYAEFRRSTRAAMREKVSSLGTALATSQVETTPVLRLETGTPALSLSLAPAGLAAIVLNEIRFELGSVVPINNEAAVVRFYAPDGEQQHSERARPVVIGSSVALRPLQLAMQPAASGNAPWRVEIRLPFLDAEAWTGPEGVQSIEVVYRNALTGESLPPARLLTADVLARDDGGDYGALFRSVEEVIATSGLPFALHDDALVLPAGDHRLEQTLVVPRSHRLVLDPGVTLRLAGDVSLISFRGITAEGTADRPIHIGGDDPARPWGSVAVARAPEASKLAFLTVSGGSRTSFQGIEFDGQLSFNASELILTDSEVYNAQGADGLSLKRAAFEVSRTQFVANGSDGMDSEWSQGVVRESLFINNGDDGLDLADSSVRVDDCAFHWMGDKSISAGERSRVSVDSTRLSDSEIAIASKEDSRVDVRDSEFRRNRLGFSLYRSKPVFGGGSGSVTGGLFASNNRDFSVEPGSNLEIIHVRRDAPPSASALVGSLALRPVVTRSR
jgi:hypothetical protein